MARHRSFVTEGPAWEIYVKFRQWVTEHRTHPLAYSFGVQVMQRSDKRWTLHRFRHHWNTLVIERLVRHEYITNAVVITKSWELELMSCDPRLIAAVKALEDDELLQVQQAELEQRMPQYDEHILGEQLPIKKVVLQ